MAQEALQAVGEAGWRIGNLDCIVFAQRPKIAPHREEIRHRLATILGIEPGSVGLKAKTGEEVGPVGQEQIIAAQCVVLLQPRHPEGDFQTED